MIEAEHLSKIYGSTPAIQDVDFSVEDGEIVGFLGPNGAGKTTTMRILSGYLPATTGTARIAGYDVHEQSMQVRQRIGYLPEIPPLYDEMTVEGFLFFVARIKGVSAGDRAPQVQWAIQRCNLQEKQKVLIHKLSKGFRQRVGIAQAIVHNPPVIILDEPTVGLDPRQIIEVRNLIKSLAGEHTIILSTHILPEVSMTCDRVTIINQGNVVATNTPDNLMAQLSASRGYELEVEGNAELVQPLLQVIPGVKSAEVLPQPQQNHHLIRITTESNNPDLGRDIASVVVKDTGLGLYEMRRTRPSLEDVFLELTTEEATLDLQETPLSEQVSLTSTSEDDSPESEATPSNSQPPSSSDHPTLKNDS
ncbi:ABC transporter ATP-binding protein [Spirulina sp. CS-785/01]|uniref:ABC transporter ATP-binding protein n=1 Tax=Spirulina sp. CS-785/01 TaxID=3021716 RepID=UPI00232A7A50|nr:ABC transporter ATP-binding protein [Spirulina sp. CS-785/01]MDB9312159.1 ABC transporter ATP-binding protein [Spirulina sp. CS-785/01]